LLVKIFNSHIFFTPHIFADIGNTQTPFLEIPLFTTFLLKSADSQIFF
jgi:hypothetical protein